MPAVRTDEDWGVLRTNHGRHHAKLLNMSQYLSNRVGGAEGSDATPVIPADDTSLEEHGSHHCSHHLEARFLRQLLALPTDTRTPVFVVAADVIEASSHHDDRTIAETALACLAEHALVTQDPLGLGLLARSRALLGSGDDAAPLYEEALAQLERSGNPIQLARTQLLYGQWLRRKNRRRAAREQLAAAVETFDSRRAHELADRARHELLASGGTARRRVDETRNQLTLQETRVARLAADGATNAEIADRLYISANTVDYHLRKVYRKLAIRSRVQLSRVTVAAVAG